MALRYPRANLETIEREVQPVELGQAEILEWETDGMLLACGSMVGSCLRVAERLHERYGLRVGVVNARFVKPLDRVTIGKAIEECGFVLTVEEGCLMGGFGSAVLEAANEAGLPTSHVRRLGLPDRYVMHAERDEQLAEVGLDVEGITQAALALAIATGWTPPRAGRRIQRQRQGRDQAILRSRPRARNPGRQRTVLRSMNDFRPSVGSALPIGGGGGLPYHVGDSMGPRIPRSVLIRRRPHRHRARRPWPPPGRPSSRPLRLVILGNGIKPEVHALAEGDGRCT